MTTFLCVDAVARFFANWHLRGLLRSQAFPFSGSPSSGSPFFGQVVAMISQIMLSLVDFCQLIGAERLSTYWRGEPTGFGQQGTHPSINFRHSIRHHYQPYLRILTRSKDRPAAGHNAGG